MASTRKFGLLCCAILAALMACGAPMAPARAETTVSIAVVNDFAGWNPYADSTEQMYMIWCQTYGCLGTFNTLTGEYEGMLAKSWDTDKSDPRIWYFHLRHGLKRQHDGKELTAADVVHSINRTRNDPHTAQANNVHPIASAEAVDKYTVKVVTTEPTAPLLSYIFDRVIITGKDLYDKYGADADRKAPWGWGPYSVEDIEIGQRMVLRKNPNWPGIKTSNPDRIIFTRIKEDEARITALLDGEVQIAIAIPPHLASRVESAKGVKAVGVPSVEDMFLAMNPKFQAVGQQEVAPGGRLCHRPQGDHRLDLPGPRRACSTDRSAPDNTGTRPTSRRNIRYDPAKAKQLVAEAGYSQWPRRRALLRPSIATSMTGRLRKRSPRC